jgi:hypothetical protein
MSYVHFPGSAVIAPCTGVEPGTGHLDCQWTFCPSVLPVSVCLLPAMSGRSCHVLKETEQNLVQDFLLVSGHNVHLPYQKA